MRYYNADGLSTPDEGIIPDVFIPDGYLIGKFEIGDTNERLLSAAIKYLTDKREDPKTVPASTSSFEFAFTPIGEPSFVTEFNQ